MPIPEQAFAALRAAVRWNPNGARGLLAVLREFPTWVEYKNDPYGPLHIILYAGSHWQWITNGIGVPVKPIPFPDDKLAACAVFGAEWAQRRFTKQELADMIEVILTESGNQF